MCTNAYFGWRSAHYPFTYIIKKRWSCTKHCNSIAFLFLLPTDTMASSWMGMLEVSCCTRPCDGNVGTPDVALRTTIYVGRLPIYTTFHGYILLPWLNAWTVFWARITRTLRSSWWMTEVLTAAAPSVTNMRAGTTG